MPYSVHTYVLLLPTSFPERALSAPLASTRAQLAIFVSKNFRAASSASWTFAASVPTPCAPSGLPPACARRGYPALARHPDGEETWKDAAHLTTEDLDHGSRPFAPVETLGLRSVGDGVDVCDLAALRVRAEDINGLAELLRLEDDALHDLSVRVHVEHGEVCGLVRLILEELLERVAGLCAWTGQLSCHASAYAG